MNALEKKNGVAVRFGTLVRLVCGIFRSRRYSRRSGGLRTADLRRGPGAARSAEGSSVPTDAAQPGESRRDLFLCRCFGSAGGLRGGGLGARAHAVVQPQSAAGRSSSSARCISAWDRTTSRATISKRRPPPIRRQRSAPASTSIWRRSKRPQSRHHLSGYVFLGGQYQTDANVAPGSPLILSPIGPVLLNSQFLKATVGQHLRQRVAALQLRSWRPEPRYDRRHQRRLRQSLF